MNEFSKLTVGSWLSAFVLASALGAMGCGDNSNVDRLPRTSGPSLPAAENIQSPAQEFFVPDGDDIPDVIDRFVKNPTNPEELVFIPREEGGVFVWIARDRYGYAIMTSDTDGGSAQVLSRTSYRPANLMGDEVAVFWSADARSDIYAYDWTTGQVENIHSLGNIVTSMTLDDSFIYVGTADGAISMGDRGAGQTLELTTAAGIPSHMLREGDSVLWTTASDGNDGGSLFDYNMEKDLTTEMLSGFFFDTGFEADSAGIYWADTYERAIMMVDRVGGEPIAVAESQYGLSAVTSDRFHLYFATAADTQIKTVAKEGGSVIPLGDGAADVSDLVVTDDGRLFLINLDFIYFVEL
jgi:hypothetical protein